MIPPLRGQSNSGSQFAPIEFATAKQWTGALDQPPTTERATIHCVMDAAVRSGDLKRVQELIRSGLDMSEACRYTLQFRCRGDTTVLHLAIEDGYTDIALALLGAGANVHAKDSNGWTALHWACLRGFEEVVQSLIDKGSRVNERDKSGRTPLVMADACGHIAISMYLLRAGANCKGLTQEQVHCLFCQACRECCLLAVNILLKDGCSVSILSKEEQERLLHHACHEDGMFIVHSLLEDGCKVSILSTEEQEWLLHRACREGDVFVVHSLLEDGCKVSILSTEEQEWLLRCTFSKDVFVVHTLLQNGCSIRILSTEEQERLFRCAFREGNVFVVRTLVKNGYSIRILSTEEQERLLHFACLEGDVFVVEALLAIGCNMNCVSFGFTPLMDATEKDNEEVVKKLILAGANLGMQPTDGDTALHIAATHNSIQCGILLATGGASVRTKNNLAETPLDLASAEFKEAIKQALSFTTRKALSIIGDAESGKSTLIAALRAESNSFLGKIINRFRRVSDCRLRTAGIETVSHHSQRYGEVLFFDFAGQDDYHGPHQMFLESLLSKPGVSMTLLLVVKMTEEEDAILHQLHRWLTPVALMATPASPPQVIIIGSFLDKVKSKGEATAKLTRCIEATRGDMEELPLEFVGTSFLNCRQPQSEGIDQICKFLQDIPIPEFSAIHTRYSLAWVLSQIRSSFTAQAVQLQKFSVWVQGNKDNLSRTMPPPEEVCQDLSVAGHALYLPNREDPPKSWLVLDLPSILHDVYGTLFSQYKEIGNEFGLLHCRHLAKLFPHLDLEMVQQLLISLEFCLPVDPSVLKVELSELTQSKEASGWLFFPALISAKPPQSILQGLPQQSVRYLCWQLRTAKKHSILAHVLQTILLRLAAHFVVKHQLSEGVQQNCCSIWWNGIEWQSKKGVDVSVHIKSRVIQVIGASVAQADKTCQYMYLMDIISDILVTIHQLSPKLVADSYILHPLITADQNYITISSPQELFPVADIQSSIIDGEAFSLSLKGTKTDRSSRAAVSELFGGCTPSLQDIVRISWPQSEQGRAELHSEGNSVPTDFMTVPAGAQALLDVSSTPDMRDLDELVLTAVAANWQRVALWLGVEGCISEVVLKNHPNDCEGACQDMLNRWLRREHHTGGEERTWSTLLTALGRAGFEELEGRLTREHFHQAISS